MVRELGFALTVNIVLHRANIGRLITHLAGRAWVPSASIGQYTVLRLVSKSRGTPADADQIEEAVRVARL
jgi:hypothetical protein